jgi:hypothetical protein
MREIASTARSCEFLKDMYKALAREREAWRKLSGGEGAAGGREDAMIGRAALMAVEGVIEEIDRLVDDYEYSKEGGIWR